jgi:hypothetical protein
VVLGGQQVDVDHERAVGREVRQLQRSARVILDAAIRCHTPTSAIVTVEVHEAHTSVTERRGYASPAG